MKKLVLVVLALAWMTACSSQSTAPAPAAKPEPKTTEQLTARSALQKCYIAARGWAPDAKPFRVESQASSDSKGKDGLSAIWRSSFASAAHHGVKPYIWSGSIAPDAPSRGINSGTEDTYNPSNSSTQIFDFAYLKIDSDKALETAQKHGGDKLVAKSPETTIFYDLDWSSATNELIWHVLYGDTRDSAKLRVAVNATTGEFMRVEK
ncbi:MAG TPA: hypothetical protein VH088_17500 [Terriglobales bacterium]|jgi:hypothetical protein|nr:hypothetical protein [Terriglobales bacterium]